MRVMKVNTHAINHHAEAVVLSCLATPAWILINLALILIVQNWVILILGIVSIVLIYIDTRNADRGCIEKFGDEYKRYIQSVPQLNLLTGIIRMLRSRR